MCKPVLPDVIFDNPKRETEVEFYKKMVTKAEVMEEERKRHVATNKQCGFFQNRTNSGGLNETR
jgi:hypothetical protein